MPLALPLSEREQRLLFDSAHVIVRDDRGHIRAWTARDEEIYGWGVAEAVGRSYDELLHPELPGSREDLERTALETGAWEGEISHFDRRGHRRVLRSRWVPCRHEEDGRITFIETNREVTDLLWVERELRARERDFQAFFRLNGVGNVIVEPQTGHFYTVNQAFCDITGYSAEELAHLSAADLTHADDRARDADGWRACLESSRAHYTIEKRYVRRNGEIIWVSVTSTLIRDDSGYPLYAFGVVMDVTTRHHALQQLAASQQDLAQLIDERTSELQAANETLDRRNAQLDALLDASPAAIVSLDPRGVIEMWNSGATKLFGLDAREVQGRAFGDLPLAWTPARTLEELLTSRQDDQAELRVRTPAGRERDLGVWSAPYPGTDEVPGGHVLVLLDTTEKKALENALIEAGEREQRRVGHELHDHLAQQLVGAAFGAQALARELQRTGSASATRAADLARLINESVLDARNLARGINPVEIDSAGLMSALQELASRHPGDAQIEMHCPEPVLVHSSGTALHVFRIAQQAVANALQHAHATHIVIRLDQEDGTVTLSVSDDGDPLAGAPAGGHGIMKYRAQAIHGQLTIEPSPCGGTSVRCTFANQA